MEPICRQVWVWAHAEGLGDVMKRWLGESGKETHDSWAICKVVYEGKYVGDLGVTVAFFVL
jgi:hypothetical protein